MLSLILLLVCMMICYYNMILKTKSNDHSRDIYHYNMSHVHNHAHFDICAHTSIMCFYYFRIGHMSFICPIFRTFTINSRVNAIWFSKTNKYGSKFIWIPKSSPNVVGGASRIGT